MADTPALPPVDLNIASERLELLAQIYKATLPVTDPARVIPPLPNTPSWLPKVDAAATNTDLPHVFAVYVDSKKQAVVPVLQGAVLQEVIKANDYTEASTINGAFSKAEIMLARAPVLYLMGLGFDNVTVTAEQQAYKITAQYKGIAVEFFVFISDDKLNFVNAAKEVKSFLETNATKLAKNDVVMFSDADDFYQITRHKVAGQETRYFLNTGALTTENFASLDQAFQTMLANGQVPATAQAKWSDFYYDLNLDGTIDVGTTRDDLRGQIAVDENGFMSVGAGSAKTAVALPATAAAAPVAVSVPASHVDYAVQLANLGFTEVQVAQTDGLYSVQSKYKETTVLFDIGANVESDNFDKVAQEISAFLKVQKLPKNTEILFSASQKFYVITTHKTVSHMAAQEVQTENAVAYYKIPVGKLSGSNFRRLDVAYDKLSLQIMLHQYLSADWGDFDYELTTKNKVYAVTTDEQIIEVNGEGGRYLIDERLPLMSPDDISSLKENGQDIGGPAKLQYYARLFDDDAPGVLNITEQDYIDMVESLGSYPKSFYKNSVTIDHVIDVVLLKALNADYEKDPFGPMKNKAGIHGLGQFTHSPRALLLLNAIAAHSANEDLKAAARLEIQSFSFEKVEDVKKLTALFNAKKPDSLLALETMGTLAWVYHNSADEEVRNEIEKLSQTFNKMRIAQPSEHPTLFAADDDREVWDFYVITFLKRIRTNDPKAEVD